MRLLIKRKLVKENYEVYQAADGREGIAKALEIEPDLIVLDLMLPEINGKEVCLAIRRNLPNQPIYILMLSTIDDVDEKVE